MHSTRWQVPMKNLSTLWGWLWRRFSSMRGPNMDGWVGDAWSLRKRGARPGFERRFFSEESSQGAM